MKTYVCLVLACLVALCCARKIRPPGLVARDVSEKQQRTNEEEENVVKNINLKSLLIGQRGIFSCRQAGEECSGMPRCCGSAVCYWEGGYSIKTSGRCVDCVAAGRSCQRDSQCCDNTICHKSSTWATDGECGPKRPVGAECHDNDQCVSDYCHIGWMSDVRGHGGVCAHSARHV